MLSTPIPQDIINLIINGLHNDIATLKACSFVSQSFLAPSRAKLFSDIELTTKTSPRFFNLLRDSPHIALLVRKLCLSDDETQYAPPGSGLEGSIEYEGNLPTTLRMLHYIENFTIWCQRGSLNWRDISENLASAIFNLLERPSLTSVTLCSVNAFPIGQLSRCMNLAELTLLWVLVDRSGDIELGLPPPSIDPSRDTAHSLESLETIESGGCLHLLTELTSNPQSSLKVCRLRKFVVTPRELDEISDMQKIIDTARSSLQTLELHFDKLMDSGVHVALHTLSFGTLPNLRSLTVSVIFTSSIEDDHFAIILHLLETITLRGELRIVIIDIYFCDYGWRHAPEIFRYSGWASLDASLSQSAYMRLHRVHINTWDLALSPEDGHDVASNFETIIRRQLPLLDAKGILFVNVS